MPHHVLFRLFFYRCDENLIDPLAIHVYHLKPKAGPFKVISNCRYTT